MYPQSPSQTVGPFFAFGLISGDENKLVNDQTAGQRITLTGQLFDGDGAPVLDGLIEIWQPDTNGHFNHPNDPNQAKADPNFAGFGRSQTEDAGTFRFDTIKPGSIPNIDGAAPYINLRVFARGMLIHAVTRIYFADEAANASDPVLANVDPARRDTLIAQPESAAGGVVYRFDLHLQGDNETVFFDA